MLLLIQSSAALSTKPPFCGLGCPSPAGDALPLAFLSTNSVHHTPFTYALPRRVYILTVGQPVGLSRDRVVGKWVSTE